MTFQRTLHLIPSDTLTSLPSELPSNSSNLHIPNLSYQSLAELAPLETQYLAGIDVDWMLTDLQWSD
jgi:hypothetical protein